jgi:molecular chaperone GrpE
MSKSEASPPGPQEHESGQEPQEAQRPHVEQAQSGAASLTGMPEREMPYPDLQARIGELEARVVALEKEKSSLQDEILRRAADSENFRKRIFREKEEAIRYANAGLLSDVVPIIDDFERAIQSAEESKDFAAFHAGVSLIEKQLVSVLERNWGLKRFSAEGELFDPERHEAIAAEESDEHDTSVVLEEYQKGYFLHDRVLRPSKVKVAKPIPPGGENGKNA